MADLIYSVFIVNPTTGDQYELPFESINYIEELNNGGQATLSFDYASIKEVADKYSATIIDIFTATFRELKIYRSDGITLWRGIISEYNRTKNTFGKGAITVAAVDYFSIFQKRRTALTRAFTSVDPATIAWTLINESQTSDSPYSDFGITQGVAAATGLTQSITYQFAEVRQEIINLSNATQQGSFDFDIDNTKKFNTYTSKGALRANIYLDDNNIIEESIKIPLVLSLVNGVYVIGAGINADVVYVSRQASNSYKTAFKKLEDV